MPEFIQPCFKRVSSISRHNPVWQTVSYIHHPICGYLVCFAVICSVYIDLLLIAASLKSPVPDLRCFVVICGV